MLTNQASTKENFFGKKITTEDLIYQTKITENGTSSSGLVLSPDAFIF